MYRAASISVVALGLGLLVTATDRTFALEIWLSDAGMPGEGVVVDNLDREFDEPLSAQEMFIWVRPDGGETLGAIELNLTSSNREVIDFTGATMHNPLLEQEFFLPKDMRRFEFVIDPAIPDPSSSIQRFGGFSVAQQAWLGVGLGPASTATDPLYDAEADAWLLATVTYDVIGSGSTDLFLQIGNNGIQQKGGSSVDVDVVFGGGADRPLNGDTNRMVNSTTRDGSITLSGDYLRPETWYDVPIADLPDPDPIAVLPPDQGTGPVDAGNVPAEPIDEVAGGDPNESDEPAPDPPVDRPSERTPILTPGIEWFILDPDLSDFQARAILLGWDLLDMVIPVESDTGEGFLPLPRFSTTQDRAVPEPSTFLILGIGLLSIAGTVRRRGNTITRIL